MEGGSGFPAPIMVDVRRRKLAIITMNVSVLAAALSWLLVLFSVMYSPAAIPWALGVAIVLTVIGAYALGHDLHSTHLPHLHHTERTSDGA